jgi:hypothetical protein
MAWRFRVGTTTEIAGDRLGIDALPLSAAGPLARSPAPTIAALARL